MATTGLQKSWQGPSRQGLMGRERPSQGVLRKCELCNAAVPDPGSEKEGRSRPLPNSPFGTATPRGEPQTQRAQQVREKCPCTSKSLFRAHAPPLSHVRSPIRTKHHFSVAKISLQQARCPPIGIAVDHDLDGAILDRRLQRERPLQCDRHPAKSVQHERSTDRIYNVSEQGNKKEKGNGEE